jgi:4-diphosphocytidyl-2-C-methyl-D-erythritol kinase
MATRVRSFSKINLGLAIGPVRADGFHSLTTMYQTLDLHDLVTVTAHRADATQITLTTNHPQVPTDDRNTAWKMVERCLLRLGTAEVAIHIEKNLPVQGGMGAGSANAAAALLGLEKELGQTLSDPTRLELATEIGSDVPLFLVGGSVLGISRGEKVTPLPDLPAIPCVVAIPSVGVSTPQAFRDWDARAAASSLTPQAIQANLEQLSLAYSSILAKFDPAKISVEPGTSGIAHDRNSVKTEDGRLNDLAENTLLALVRTGIGNALQNDFEEVVFPQYPSLRENKRQLMGSDSGSPALYAALSGSGSALFGLYRSKADARAAQQRVQASGTQALLTATLPRFDYWRRMFAG